ncbi:fungal-specific transcription factor domain-containing protein [Pyronema omphalodes]|nr:fungal-specific transcription factor domain-containing protein [Pyronema omphalodes]
MSTSDSGSPAQKRLRVSRACEQCRSKKIKCDGLQPTCSPCAGLSIQCSYGSSPKKRGLAPGSVSALEKSVKLLQRILGLLLVSVNSADKALIALIQQHATTLFEDSDDALRLTKAWKEGSVLEALEALQANGVDGLKCQRQLSDGKADSRTEVNESYARFRVELSPADNAEPNSSRNAKQTTRPITDNNAGATQQAGRESEVMQNTQSSNAGGGAENSGDGNSIRPNVHSSSFTGIPFIQQSPSDTAASNFGESFTNLQIPFSPANNSAVSSMSSTNPSYPYGPNTYVPQSGFLLPVPSPTSNVERTTVFPLLSRDKTPEICSIPSNSRFLLDIYFCYSHAWFPILDKYDILRLLHTINSQSAGLALNSVHPNKKALLYALLALASTQNDSVIAQQSKGNVSSPQQYSSSTSADLYVSAQKLLFDSKEYGLEHVQALLLLSIVSMSHMQLNTSWLLIGLAGRISSDIGLNAPESTPFAKRTWMGYLVLECMLSFWMERKPQVVDSDWGFSHIPEDGWEEWDVWKAIPQIETAEQGGGHEPAHIASVFNQLVKLSRIIRRIAIQSSDQLRQDPELESQRKTLLQQLRTWARELPQAYSLNTATYANSQQPAISSMPHTLNLHLLYLHALIRLHQPPILGYARPDDTSKTVKDSAIISTEVILESFKAHRSLGVAPCPFIHYVASIYHDPMVREGNDTAASRISKLYSAEFLILTAADGFEPGRALLRSTTAVNVAPSINSASSITNNPASEAQFIPSPSIMGGSSDGSGMMQDFYSPVNRRRQPPSMSLREEDLNASNIATFPIFPTQPAVSPDTLDDEFGMFDLPWSHNGIPEFIQNLGYVGVSPEAGIDMMNKPPTTNRDHTMMDRVGTPQHNIYAGRGLNTVLEQYLGDVLGAGNGNASGGQQQGR